MNIQILINPQILSISPKVNEPKAKEQAQKSDNQPENTSEPVRFSSSVAELVTNKYSTYLPPNQPVAYQQQAQDNVIEAEFVDEETLPDAQKEPASDFKDYVTDSYDSVSETKGQVLSRYA